MTIQRHCARCGETCGTGSRRVFLRVGFASYADRRFERSADLTGEWCARCAWMLLDFALALMPSTAQPANDVPALLLPTPERAVSLMETHDVSTTPANDIKPRRKKRRAAGASAAARSGSTDVEGSQASVADSNGAGSSRPPLSGVHERPEATAELVRIECPCCGKGYNVGPLCRELACSCGNVAQTRALRKPQPVGYRSSGARLVPGAAAAPLPEPPLRGGVPRSGRGGVQR